MGGHFREGQGSTATKERCDDNDNGNSNGNGGVGGPRGRIGKQQNGMMFDCSRDRPCTDYGKSFMCQLSRNVGLS
jgi:hypothetical protein